MTILEVAPAGWGRKRDSRETGRAARGRNCNNVEGASEEQNIGNICDFKEQVMTGQISLHHYQRTHLHVVVLLEELHASLHDRGQVEVHHFVCGPVACGQHLYRGEREG